MVRMTWGAPLSAVIGAVIALGSTLLVDIRRDRNQRGRDRHLERRKQCVEFTVALAEAHGALRTVARRQDGDPRDRRLAAGDAVAGVYPVREQLLVSGTPEQLAAGESAFERLIGVRNAVRAGATLDSVEYHDAYHAFAEALWRFRLAIRADLGEPELAPESLNRVDWADREHCDRCRSRAAPGLPLGDAG